ncbi:MAG: hypothetical protein COU65_01290 [Candidatus Pacebacteria bacterium CG10_big_fil_rev_8_21_14_0_10_42_12]|nr:hypothetical protein [Candidatus Paceibacterota bacterium]PIR62838.1 MAG: hypothetical protein COU65_01290 [Candidatus Pacebacteria bacterium CG10_big_fil_rev_8_21_14_0_10_42_12]
MQLSNLFAEAKKTGEKQVLCISITDASVQSLFVSVSGKVVRVRSQSPRLHYSDVNSLIVKTDESLQQLGQESESVSEVVFGLERSWIDKGDIAEKHKQTLERLMKDLSLKPIGFADHTEALAQHFLVSQPQIPRVLVLVSQSLVTVALLDQGTMLAVQDIGHSDDIVADITEGLARLKPENGYLPSKITVASFLLPDEEILVAQQDLQGADWQQQGFFLQVPVVEHLAEVEALQYLAIQVGSVAPQQSKDTNTEIVEKEETALPAVVAEASSQEFGFEEAEVATEDAPKSFGIPIVAKRLWQNSDNIESPTGYSPDDSFDDEPFAITLKHKPHKFAIMGVIAGLLALGIIAIIGIIFFSTAVVTITPKVVTVSKEVDIALDSSISATDTKERVIKAEQYSEEFQNERSADTSGISLVGDTASGTVTIFNKTESDKTFEKGTSLSADTYNFVTNEQVTVPAAQVSTKDGGAGEVKDYGQKSVSVSAVAIGADSNLSKDTELTVASFAPSSYAATVAESFSGGSSREVRVVSATDLEVLLSEAKAEILKEAETAFSKASGSGKYILPPQQLTITSTKFDFEEGDETNSVTLNLVAEVQSLSYSKEDLMPVVKDILQSEIPEGYELVDSDPQLLSSPAEDIDLTKKVSITVNMSARAQAIIDQQEVLKIAQGKKRAEAERLLTEKFQIQSVIAKLEPNLINSFWQNLPKSSDRMKVVVESSL